MIQRIQTLYLLLIAGLSAAAMFMPLTYFSTASGELFNISAIGVKTASGEAIQGTIYMMVLAAAAILIPLVNIFLFKNRMLQLRLCGIEGVVLVGNYAMIGAYTYLGTRAFAHIGVESVGFHPALFAPAVAIVLCFLAGKAMLSDELLVRSVDRIR